MKKHLSVLMLAVRSSVYKVILMILALGAVQAGLFWMEMKKRTATPELAEMVRLETVLEYSHIYLAAGIGFFLLCAVLSLSGCEFGSKLRYTLRRLAVGEKTVTIWWAVYNTCCFAIFWMSQILVMVLLCRWYCANAPEGTFGPQTVFLAFYRDRYLHSLMPLAEVSRWVRNILLCVCLGFCSAKFSFNLRRDKKGIAIFVLGAMVFGAFCLEMGNLAMDLTLSVYAAFVAVISGWSLWTSKGEDEDE